MYFLVIFDAKPWYRGVLTLERGKHGGSTGPAEHLLHTTPSKYGRR